MSNKNNGLDGALKELEQPANVASEGAYVTDKEMCRRLGVSLKIGRQAARTLIGFPPKDASLGHKRYWPAVDAFMKKRNAPPAFR